MKNPLVSDRLPNNITSPRISVAIITFNHAKFIGACLDSVLDQDLDEPYEIVVSDDRSNDGTSDIVRDYARRYPDKIRALIREVNLGRGGRNLEATIRDCRGSYIATLEGDDFWICRDKLRRQVDFLDNNPEFSACYSATVSANEQGLISSVRIRPEPDRDYALIDVLRVKAGSNIAVRSLMFRSEAFPGFPPWVRRQKMADKALTVLLAQRGRLRRFGEPMAVHRYHPGGLWTSLGYSKQRWYQVRYYSALLRWIDRKHRDEVQRQLNLARLRLGWTLLMEGQGKRGRRLLRALSKRRGGLGWFAWISVGANTVSNSLRRAAAKTIRSLRGNKSPITPTS